MPSSNRRDSPTRETLLQYDRDAAHQQRFAILASAVGEMSIIDETFLNICAVSASRIDDLVMSEHARILLLVEQTRTEILFSNRWSPKEIESLAQFLVQEPAEAVARLQESRSGCAWLAQEWARLLECWKQGSPWSSREWDHALNLMGLRRGDAKPNRIKSTFLDLSLSRETCIVQLEEHIRRLEDRALVSYADARRIAKEKYGSGFEQEEGIQELRKLAETYRRDFNRAWKSLVEYGCVRQLPAASTTKRRKKSDRR
jgi:hypothetical protein